jgi:hypothetical protein
MSCVAKEAALGLILQQQVVGVRGNVGQVRNVCGSSQKGVRDACQKPSQPPGLCDSPIWITLDRSVEIELVKQTTQSLGSKHGRKPGQKTQIPNTLDPTSSRKQNVSNGSNIQRLGAAGLFETLQAEQCDDRPPARSQLLLKAVAIPR